MAQIDLDTVRQLIDMMAEHHLTELQYKNGDMEIELRRGGSAVATAVPEPVMVAAPAAAAPAEVPASDEPELTAITSPMVGTFYAAPDPDTPPFVTPGSAVTEDSPVCIIEAMKVFNEIKAEVNGIIEKVVAKNAEAVEYGQPLFYVRPN